jgi:sortase A
MFTDLNLVEKGDQFYFHILGQVFAYQVDRIQVIEPSDVKYLSIEYKKDYATLVTCTPYGVNTHRLLVRGHRVDNDDTDATRITADAMRFEPVIVAPLVAAPILFVLLIILLVSTSKWNRQRRAHRTKDELRDVMHRIGTALKEGGIFYTSFKYGDFAGERNGRYFRDFTEESFREFLTDFHEFRMTDQWITSDVRPNRGEERWLNVLLRRTM